jgi:hypothetical protein
MHTCERAERLDLTPCLLRAIEDHKYLRSRDSCREVDFLTAAGEFRERHESQWRAAKVRSDNALQVQEMRRHLWIESEKAGRDVGRNAAGADWVAKHAGEWRRHRESLEGNGFRTAVIEVRSSHGEAAPLEAALGAVGGLDADVFLSQPTVSRPHFGLQMEPGAESSPFLVLDPGRREELDQLRLEPGAALRLVAYGRQAEAALQRLRAALG